MVLVQNYLQQSSDGFSHLQFVLNQTLSNFTVHKQNKSKQKCMVPLESGKISDFSNQAQLNFGQTMIFPEF